MLSQKAKYALKAMLELVELDEGDLLQAGEIAERQHVPRKFLEMILLELRRHGLVESHRGKHGGYALAKPADAITFGEIIRIIDGPLAPIPCASLSGYRRCDDCADERSCAIRGAMQQARAALSNILDGLTLAQASKPDTSPTLLG